MATLSYREAARTVRRSVRTIKRWRSAGHDHDMGDPAGPAVRVVDEDLLFATLRARLDAWPSHQYRLRRRRRAEAAANQPPGVGGWGVMLDAVGRHSPRKRLKGRNSRRIRPLSVGMTGFEPATP